MPHLHDFTCFFPHFNAHFFWDFSAMFDDTEGQCPIFLHGQAMKFFNLVRPRLFFLCELTKVDTSGHPLVLYLCEYSRYKFTRVITCVYVYICIYNISIYIYTHVYYYMIYMHDTLHFTYNLKMTMTVVPVSLLVFDSEPAVIAALQGKEVRCRRCQTCVPRCAFPSFSDCSRHSGSFRHIFDRDQCSMTVQWNTREPFDVKFIYI